MNQHSLSKVELLPREIIEMIHLYALEPNLPRASPTIARVVSREFIYQTFVIQAFWNNPHGASYSPRVRGGPQYACAMPDICGKSRRFARWYRFLSIDEQSRLQRNVVRCRWFTGYQLKAILPVLFHWTHGTSFCKPCSKDYHDPEANKFPLMKIIFPPRKIFLHPWDDDKLLLLRTFYLDLGKMIFWKLTSAEGSDSYVAPVLETDLYLHSLHTALVQEEAHVFIYILRLSQIADFLNQHERSESEYGSLITCASENPTFREHLHQTNAALLQAENIIINSKNPESTLGSLGYT